MTTLRASGTIEAVVPVRILKVRRRGILFGPWQVQVMVEDGKEREPYWVFEHDTLNVNVKVEID